MNQATTDRLHYLARVFKNARKNLAKGIENMVTSVAIVQDDDNVWAVEDRAQLVISKARAIAGSQESFKVATKALQEAHEMLIAFGGTHAQFTTATGLHHDTYLPIA